MLVTIEGIYSTMVNRRGPCARGPGRACVRLPVASPAGAENKRDHRPRHLTPLPVHCYTCRRSFLFIIF